MPTRTEWLPAAVLHTVRLAVEACQQYRHLSPFYSIKQKNNCGIPHFPSVSNAWVSSILECCYTDFETASIIFAPDQLQAWMERTYLLSLSLSLSLSLCACARAVFSLFFSSFFFLFFFPGEGGHLSACLVWAVRVLGFADVLKDSPIRRSHKMWSCYSVWESVSSSSALKYWK
jgi:hypothetical protein